MSSKNFKNFLVFATFLNIGSGMFRIFLMWVIHALYQNNIYNGIAGFMFAAPMVASFVIGPFVDRWSKSKVLKLACFVQLLVAGLLLGLSFLSTDPGVWVLHLAILIFSIMSVFARAAQMAILPNLVESEFLVKANVRLHIVGTIGGLFVSVILYVMMVRGAGFELVYAVNAVVFLLALLVPMHSTEELQKTTYLAELKEGLAYMKSGVLLPLAMALVGMSFFADAAYINLPMFAETHIGTASGFIVLAAIALAGGLVGSYIAGVLSAKLKLSTIFVLCFVFAGAVRILFVNVIPNNYTRGLLVLVLYAGLAAAIGIFFNSLTQKLPPKNIIGRITTINASLLAAFAAIGAVAGGFAGYYFESIDTVFIVQGASYILIGLCLCLSKQVRGLPKVGELS